MSLIFLKNDDESVIDGRPNGMKPYRWSNYFTQPIKIPPNAQVAYVSSSFSLNPNDEIEGNPYGVVIGDPCLNPTIPLYLPTQHLLGTQAINNVGLQPNYYGVDGDFNHIYINESTGATPFTYSGLMQNQQYQTGFNFLRRSDSKVDVRCVQRGTNDTFNQSFNALGSNPTLTYTNGDVYSAGVNYLGDGTNDNSSIIKDVALYAMDAPTAGKVSFANINCLQPQPNSAVTALPANPISNFYNTGYASTFMNDPNMTGADGNVFNWFAQSAFNNNFNHYNTQSYGLIASATGIKKNVSQNSVSDNNGGHASIAGAGSGGYALFGFGNIPQAAANTHYDAGYVGGAGAVVGFCGLSQQSFGVHSIDYMFKNQGQDLATSIKVFTEEVDLNDSASPLANTPPTNPNVGAFGAKARFIFGIDMVENGGSLLAELKILDPNSSLDNSAYIPLRQLDVKELCSGTDPISGVNFGGNYHLNTDNTTGGIRPGMLNFRFRWTTPYTMCCEYCISEPAGGSYKLTTDEPYLPSASNPSVGNPLTGWCMMYDMADAAATDNYYFPAILGDIGAVMYPQAYRHNIYMKGHFDVRRSSQVLENQLAGVEGAEAYTNTQQIPYLTRTAENFGDLSVFSKGTNNVPAFMATCVPEVFSANGLSEKSISFVLNELVDLGEPSKFLDIYGNPIYALYHPAQLNLGNELGITSSGTEGSITLNNDIDGVGTDYIAYGTNGGAAINALDDTFSNHIQLTNLPIQSQQGVKSTMNKTIYVINSLNVSSSQGTGAGVRKYGDTAPYLLWVDLNNLGEMELNRIQILITDDDNKEQRIMVRNTDVVIMIRQKPKRDEGYVPNNIPVTY